MITLKKPGSQPAITTMTLLGEDFTLTLLPLSDEEYSEVFRPFRKVSQVVNKITRQMDRQAYFEDDKNKELDQALDALLCQKLLDFDGIADEQGQPLDGKLNENKIALGNVVVDDVESIDLVDEATGDKGVMKLPRKKKFKFLILDRAKELSSSQIEIKN